MIIGRYCIIFNCTAIPTDREEELRIVVNDGTCNICHDVTAVNLSLITLLYTQCLQRSVLGSGASSTGRENEAANRVLDLTALQEVSSASAFGFQMYQLSWILLSRRAVCFRECELASMSCVYCQFCYQ
jgi:hypothetical protein